MQPSTIDDLKNESAFRRKRAMTDNEIADKIDDIVRIASENLPPRVPTDLLRRAREAGERMTQADALEKALQSLGKPAYLETIVEHANSLALPLKPTSLDNLRSAMSRDERFRSFGSNVWGLESRDKSVLLATSLATNLAKSGDTNVSANGIGQADNPLSHPGYRTRIRPDLAAGEQHQNGGET